MDVMNVANYGNEYVTDAAYDTGWYSSFINESGFYDRAG